MGHDYVWIEYAKIRAELLKDSPKKIERKETPHLDPNSKKMGLGDMALCC